MENKINAKLIADSITESGNRISSFILTIPQIVVKELLRHRMFSFSSSSMRAIPFNKVVEDIKQNMFVPIAFQSHHSGMQGTKYLEGVDAKMAKRQWINSGYAAIEQATELYNLGVTKQLCSRIIEPYGYATILLTATEFDNYFKLRQPEYELNGVVYNSKKEVNLTNKPYNDLEWLKTSKSGTEIHMQLLTESILDSMKESNPKLLKEGEYHLPFGENIYDEKIIDDLNGTEYFNDYYENPIETKLKINVARCARLSYNTHDGNIDHKKDIELYNRLLEQSHGSAFEHVSIAKSDDKFYANFKGWQSYRNVLGI